MTISDKQERRATVYPNNRKALTALGENIKLACTRRGYSQTLVSERTGLSRLTIRKIEKGDPTVSMGHYVAVIGMLGMADDLAAVALDDVLGRKLQDIKMIQKPRSAS